MARRRLEGLERVLGVNALFSTAYGNVGSSIYYALGLVASLALGLTPVVFVITGVIFYLTAATYAEATAMYPEAGGSASFVPHYLGGLFWEPLRSSPADIVFGIGVVLVLALVNVRGAQESAAVNV